MRWKKIRIYKLGDKVRYTAQNGKRVWATITMDEYKSDISVQKLWLTRKDGSGHSCPYFVEYPNPHSGEKQ